MAELAERYFAGLERVRTPANLRRERARGTAFNREFERKDPAKLDTATVARWAEKLGRTRSIKTVNRYLALGSRVWRFGQQHGYAPIGFNPFRAVDRPREIPAESVTFTRKEVDAILKRIPNEIADYALAQVQTCWRPIELEALTWPTWRTGVCPSLPSLTTRGAVSASQSHQSCAGPRSP